MIDILLELLDTDWSRGWVRLRGLVLIGAIVLLPTQTGQAIGWVAKQLAAEKTREIASVLERVAASPPARGGPGELTLGTPSTKRTAAPVTRHSTPPATRVTHATPTNETSQR